MASVFSSEDGLEICLTEMFISFWLWIKLDEDEVKIIIHID